MVFVDIEGDSIPDEGNLEIHCIEDYYRIGKTKYIYLIDNMFSTGYFKPMD